MDTADPLEKNSSVVELAKLALLRYFYYLRITYLPVSHKFVYGLQMVECCQLLSLMVRGDEDVGLPWNYALFGGIWKTLELVFFPTKLLTRLEVPPALLSVVVAILLLYKLLSSVCAATGLSLVPVEVYDSIVAGGDKHFLIKFLLASDYIVSVSVLRLLFLPLLSFSVLQLRSGDGVSVISLVLLLALKTLDSMYMCGTSWFNDDLEAVSTPLAQIHMGLTNLAYVVCAVGFDYPQQKTRFAAIVLTVGVYKLSVILRTAPYHRNFRNAAEIAKGLIPALGGISLFAGVANNSSQDSMLCTSLFFALFPLLHLQLYSAMKRQVRRISKLKYPTRMFEVEHILRRQIEKKRATSTQVDNAFTRACDLFPKAEQLVLWALYYYKYLKDVTFVQVNISKLMKTRWGPVNYIECYHCYRVVEAWLKTLPEQSEPLSFWKYQQSLKEVLRKDYEITKTHCELFSELAMESPKIEKVVKLSRAISMAIGKYNKFVQTVMKQHPICPELLSLYSDFLYALTNSRQAGKYKHLSVKVTDMLKANRTDNSVDLYDSRCLIVVMSLEKPVIGNIIWAKNTELLGYAPHEIIGTDHNIVIPMPLKATHTNMLKRITMFRHHHPVYESRHHLFFAHHSGNIVGAHWKVRLVNMPGTGDMCIVAALKPRSDAGIVAFIDNEGTAVTAMVGAM